MIEEKLNKLGLVLPATPAPIASYIPAVRTGNLVFISGQIPMKEGNLLYTGQIGTEVTVEEANEAVRVCLLNALAALKSVCGNLDQVSRIVRVEGFFNAPQDFKDHSLILNIASDLLQELFGERGRHSRLAVGVSSLPKGATCEMSLIAELVA